MHRHYVGFSSMDGSTAYATGFAIDVGRKVEIQCISECKHK